MQSPFMSFDLCQKHSVQDWLVEGLLPLGYTAILASEPKAWKTCLATAIAIAVGTGQPFAGLRTIPGNVLWFALEESASERSTILHHYKNDVLESPKVFTCFEPMRIDEEENYVYLEHIWNEYEPKLVVIDPLYAAIGGYSLGEANRARRSLTLFKQFCNIKRATGLVLHHLNQTGPRYSRTARVAESAQLAATASMQILLTHYPIDRSQLPDPQHPAMSTRNSPNYNLSPVPLPADRRVINLECRGRGDVNRRWRFVSNGPLDYHQGDPDVAPPRNNDKVRAILASVASGHQRAIDVIHNTGLRPSTVRNLMASLLANGELAVEKVEDQTRFYILPAPL